MMTKNLTILGSTGSIGRQTLEVVEQLPVRVAALTAGQNVERMAEQCRRFRPQLAVMGTEEAAQRLREALAGEKIEIRSGMDGLIAAAEHPLADTVVTAVVVSSAISLRMVAEEKFMSGSAAIVLEPTGSALRM